MADRRRVIAVVPARGGSKGLPRKNVALVAGRPLLAWTADAARESLLIDHTILSSDDEEIMEVARSEGLCVPFRRPAVLSSDDTPGILPVLHALKSLSEAGESFHWVVLLQPTSPLRTGAHIDAALELAWASNAKAVVSVCPAKPVDWSFYVDASHRLTPILPADSRPARRQDAHLSFALNGAVYAAEIEWLQRHETFVGPDTVAFRMDRHVSVDIDDAVDLVVAEALLNARGEANCPTSTSTSTTTAG